MPGASLGRQDTSGEAGHPGVGLTRGRRACRLPRDLLQVAPTAPRSVALGRRLGVQPDGDQIARPWR